MGAAVTLVIPDPVTGFDKPVGTASNPYVMAGAATVPVATAVAAASQVAKAAAGTLYGLNVVSGAAAGYVMIFDRTTVPADGTVTPKKCYVLPANASLQHVWDKGLTFTSGIVIVFSTTGPFTKTESATAFIESEVS